MNDNLSASFILMAGAALLAYWFFHLTGAQRAALLARGRAAADPLAMDKNGVPKVFSQGSPGFGTAPLTPKEQAAQDAIDHPQGYAGAVRKQYGY